MGVKVRYTSLDGNTAICHRCVTRPQLSPVVSLTGEPTAAAGEQAVDNETLAWRESAVCLVEAFNDAGF